MRNELEAALRRTTEALSETTHLLALVSAPAFEAAAVRHVEVLQLQSHVVIVVVITASGAVSKPGFELEDGVDPGLVDWARAYLGETIVGKRASTSVVRRAFDDPGLSHRERRFLATLRPVFADVVATATELYVGGAASLLGDPRGPSWRPVSACSKCWSGARRFSGSCTTPSIRGRPVVRVGPELEGEELHGTSFVGATYGLPNRSLGAVGLLGPLRMDYDMAIQSVRAAAFELRPCRGRLRVAVMATAEQDYYELLGVGRDASHAEIKRAFRRLAASTIRTSAGSPTPSCGSGRSPRPTRCSPTRSGGRRTTASGMLACAAAGSPPWMRTSAASRTCSPRSSARRSSARGGAPARDRRAGPTSRPRSRSTWSTPPAGSPSTSASGSRGAARRARARARRRARRPSPARAAAGPGSSSRSRAPCSARWSGSGTCPRCDGAGRIVETPCERCDGDGRTLEDVPLSIDVPAGIHDGQRIRVRGAGHAGTLGWPPGDVYVTVRVARSRQSTARATISTFAPR